MKPPLHHYTHYVVCFHGDKTPSHVMSFQRQVSIRAAFVLLAIHGFRRQSASLSHPRSDITSAVTDYCSATLRPCATIRMTNIFVFLKTSPRWRKSACRKSGREPRKVRQSGRKASRSTRRSLSLPSLDENEASKETSDLDQPNAATRPRTSEMRLGIGSWLDSREIVIYASRELGSPRPIPGVLLLNLANSLEISSRSSGPSRHSHP